jgi:SAM-dependent methyltransferase
MHPILRRLRFSMMYWFKPPWDTGVPAPELVRAIAALPPGRAIDIGCGTGTNLRYLAEHGWEVTGIDFVPRAIAKARAKLKDFPHTLLVADATRLAALSLPGPFDLALDMGCFHGLTAAGRKGYAEGLAKWLRPGAEYLLYSFLPSSPADSRGVERADVERCFQSGFRLRRFEAGTGRPSAWYFFIRR